VTQTLVFVVSPPRLPPGEGSGNEGGTADVEDGHDFEGNDGHSVF
jgi:hypothetical protein